MRNWITNRSKAHPPMRSRQSFNHSTVTAGRRMPLAMNGYGTAERLCLALGLKSRDEIGDRIGELLKPELPHGISGLRDALGKAAQLKAVPPKKVKKAPCQEIVLTGDEVD